MSGRRRHARRVATLAELDASLTAACDAALAHGGRFSLVVLRLVGLSRDAAPDTQTRALNAATAALAEGVPAGDTLAALGTRTFGALLHGCGRTAALDTARALAEQVTTTSPSPQLQCYAGVAEWDISRSAGELLERALDELGPKRPRTGRRVANTYVPLNPPEED